jgi:protein TonB
MDRRQPLMKHLPLLAGVAVVIVMMSAFVWWIHGFMANKQQQPVRMVQNITVIRPPPPPPQETPPPPPPDKVDEPIPQNQPDPTPDNAPAPAPDLGLDAEGSAGSDAFGLAARKGGSDIAGTGGAIFAWYTGKLKDEVSDRLSSDTKLHGKKYSIGVRIWIQSDGRIRDVRVVTGTGSRDLDTVIAADLGALGRLSESPPLEMPQPISLQIISRS